MGKAMALAQQRHVRPPGERLSCDWWLCQVVGRELARTALEGGSRCRGLDEGIGSGGQQLFWRNLTKYTWH